MAHPLDSLIDQIVQQATRDGKMDDLPGAGKRLPHVDNPQDAVLARLMKEADATAPVVVLRRQILAAQEKLKTVADEAEKRQQMLYISELQTKLALEMEAFRKYG
ncbi:MAG: DnaJ family domain-containing protein [Yoonia sp.]|uniref:DnaJ family domain-containing protein n=1 Tax=Yoonia sp. TaxID=2212373 RepID=UPI003262F9E9